MIVNKIAFGAKPNKTTDNYKHNVKGIAKAGLATGVIGSLIAVSRNSDIFTKVRSGAKQLIEKPPFKKDMKITLAIAALSAIAFALSPAGKKKEKEDSITVSVSQLHFVSIN